MKAIIGGKRYDTETAQYICDLSPRGFYTGDFRHEETALYRTPRGNWFLAGEGGPMSRWARPEGLNGYSSGAGVRALDPDEARAMLEQHGETEAIERYFADQVEDA